MLKIGDRISHRCCGTSPVLGTVVRIDHFSDGRVSLVHYMPDGYERIGMPNWSFAPPDKLEWISEGEQPASAIGKAVMTPGEVRRLAKGIDARLAWIHERCLQLAAAGEDGDALAAALHEALVEEQIGPCFDATKVAEAVLRDHLGSAEEPKNSRSG